MKSIKNLDTAHPYSRKATQMKRVIQRESFMNEKTKHREAPKTKVLSKIDYFQKQVEGKTSVSLQECHEIIDNYINRNLQEIEELVKNVRKGRSKPNKLVILENLRDSEYLEYDQGFELPDFVSPEGLKKLQEFCGHFNARDHLIMTRIKKTDVDPTIMEE